MNDLYTVIWWRWLKRDVRSALTWDEAINHLKYLTLIGVTRWQLSPYRCKRRR